MKNKLVSFLLSFVLCLPAYAQQSSTLVAASGKNSLRAGGSFARVALSEINTGLMYCQYTRTLNNRVDLAAGLSFVHGRTMDFQPNITSLVSMDLTAFLNNLKIKRFSFRPGAGFSMAQATVLYAYPKPVLDIMTNKLVSHNYFNTWTPGYHVTTDVELSLPRNLFVAARVMCYDYSEADMVFSFGIGAGLRF